MSDYTPFTAEESRHLRTAIGAIVVSGAQIEGVISILTQIAWNRVGPTSAAKVIPWELSRRIDYLKGAFKRGFPDYYFDASQLLIRVAAIKKVRDPVVHGYIWGFDREAQTITFCRHELRGDGRREIHNRFAIETLTRTGKDAAVVARAIAAFLLRFSEVLPDE